MNRLQQVIPSGIIAAAGISICYVSYTTEPTEAFLFPKMISSAFAVLAVWTFIEALLGRARASQGVSVEIFKNLLPGLVIALAYVYWAAEALGFYSSAAIAFFLLLSVYDASPHQEVRSWVRRLLITAGYLAVMYGLFSLLLKVYTPRGILI